MKELLLRGRTEVIKGFIAKTGMMFDAPLKLTPEGQVDVRFSGETKACRHDLKMSKMWTLYEKNPSGITSVNVDLKWHIRWQRWS